MVAPVASFTLLLGIRAPLTVRVASAEPDRRDEGTTTEESIRDMGTRVFDLEPDPDREWTGEPRGDGLPAKKVSQRTSVEPENEP